MRKLKAAEAAKLTAADASVAPHIPHVQPDPRLTKQVVASFNVPASKTQKAQRK